jgi:hypothetical protein
MKMRRWLFGLALLSAAGCAGDGQPYGAAGKASASPQQEAASQSIEYRNHADALREMADRRQLEADLLAREVGPNVPSIGKKRRLAEELRAAATDAENKARSLSLRAPHAMVQ